MPKYYCSAQVIESFNFIKYYFFNPIWGSVMIIYYPNGNGLLKD